MYLYEAFSIEVIDCSCSLIKIFCSKDHQVFLRWYSEVSKFSFVESPFPILREDLSQHPLAFNWVHFLFLPSWTAFVWICVYFLNLLAAFLGGERRGELNSSVVLLSKLFITKDYFSNFFFPNYCWNPKSSNSKTGSIRYTKFWLC